MKSSTLTPVQHAGLLIGCIALAQLAGGLGSFFTLTEIDSWYAYLLKPAFTPPNWLFGPAWFTLYTLMGIALYLLITTKTKEDKGTAYGLFTVQWILNALWSIVFFGANMIFEGIFVIGLLWITILLCIIQFWKINKWASAAFLPYLGWVGFATALNIGIYTLNVL